MKSLLALLRRMFSGRGAADSPATHPFLGGAGTAEDPYQIRSVEDFVRIRERPEAHYVLMESLRLTEPTPPITEFKGVLNGNGKEIEGLRCSPCWIATLSGELIDILLSAARFESRDPDCSAVGLVSINSGRISGVRLRESAVGTTVESLMSGAAGIAVINQGIIEACKFQGTVRSAWSDIGGICTQNRGQGRIRDCTVTGDTRIMTDEGEFAAGICAYNLGVVQLCTVDKEVVVSSSKHGRGAIGGVVAVQQGTGVLLLSVSHAGIEVARTVAKGVGGVIGINHGMAACCGSSVVLDHESGELVGQIVGYEGPNGLLHDGRLMGDAWARIRASLQDPEKLKQLMVRSSAKTTEQDARRTPLVVVPKNSNGGEGTH